MSRKSPPVELPEDQMARLEEWIRAGSTPQQVALRARIVLEAARGPQTRRLPHGCMCGVKRPRVQRWLQRHPRFVFHFIPTSSSWLNLIERWFAELEEKAVRRGAFRSVRELKGCIAEFLAAWNAKPVPFVWTASVERILEKIARARHRLEQIKPGCTKPRKQPAKTSVAGSALMPS
jgi:transposase